MKEQRGTVKVISIILCITVLLIPLLTATSCRSKGDMFNPFGYPSEAEEYTLAIAALLALGGVKPQHVVTLIRPIASAIAAQDVQCDEQQDVAGGSTRGGGHIH
jgi:hypothetical protein